MRNFKKIILPGLCVILILAVVNTVMNYALIPYSYVRIMMHQIETEEYDTVFLGTSHGLNGISPKIVERETGRSCINLCLGGEYPRDSYYLLRKVCEKSIPKRVVYELDAGYWCTEEGQRGDFNRIYYEMPWSSAKLEYFAAKMLELDFRAALFPWFYYRGQFKEIKETIACKQSQDYKEYGSQAFQKPHQGFVDGFIKNNTAPSDKPEEEIELWNEKQKNLDSFRYFEKLVSFCRKHNVELVVITTPVPQETLEKHQKEYQQMNAYFSAYMRERGIPYWNYNLPEYKMDDFDYSLRIFSDYEGHMNGDQAEIFSLRLSKDLNRGSYEVEEIHNRDDN